jgi:hypothetical protein
MKKLANPQVGVRHEDLNPPSKLRAFGSIKLKALKAAKAIAIAAGVITTSLLLGTTSLASTNQIRNSTGRNVGTEVPSPAVLDGKDKNGEETNGSITLHNATRSRQETRSVKYVPPTRPASRTKHKSSESYPGKALNGKFTLVNDRPTPMLIYIKGPSAQGRPRYAYLPGCTTRELNGRYSTGWRVSADMRRWIPLREIGGGTLEVRASSVGEGVGVGCQYGGGSAIQTRGVGTTRGEGAVVHATLVATTGGVEVLNRATNRLRAALSLSDILRGGPVNKVPIKDRAVALGMPEDGFRQLIDLNSRCRNGLSCVEHNAFITRFMDWYSITTFQDMKSLVQVWTLGRGDGIPGNDELNKSSVADAMLTAAMYGYSDHQVRESLTKYFEQQCANRGLAAEYVQVIMRLRQSYRESTKQLERRIAYMPGSNSTPYAIRILQPHPPSARTDTAWNALDYLSKQSCNIHQRSGNPGNYGRSRI